MLFILNVVDSPIPDKRFRAIFNNDTHMDFGMRWSECYIDHHNIDKRLGYWKMIYNSNASELLYWTIPSDIVLTTFLLYGNSTDISENIKILNNEFKKNIII
jgi:hypothetical protein